MSCILLTFDDYLSLKESFMIEIRIKRYQRLASKCSVNGRCAMVPTKLEARGFQLEGDANNAIAHLRLFLSPNPCRCNLGVHPDLKFIENLSGELICRYLRYTHSK